MKALVTFGSNTGSFTVFLVKVYLRQGEQSRHFSPSCPIGLVSIKLHISKNHRECHSCYFCAFPEKKKKKSLCNLLICHNEKMHNAIAINTSGSTQGRKKGARLEGGHPLATLHGSSLRLMYKLEVLNRLDLFLGFFSQLSCHPLPLSIKK